MNTQPYALKVADLLDNELRRSVKLNTLYTHAASEIRRLHEENEKLRAALAKAQGQAALQRLNKAAEDNGEEL